MSRGERLFRLGVCVLVVALMIAPPAAGLQHAQTAERLEGVGRDPFLEQERLAVGEMGPLVGPLRLLLLPGSPPRVDHRPRDGGR